MLIPEDIKKTYRAMKGKSLPPLALRSVPEADSANTQVYILVESECILLFTGKSGVERKVIEIPHNKISKIDLKKESLFVYLMLQTDGKDMSFKFVLTDFSKLTRVINYWNKRSGTKCDKVLNLGRRTQTLDLQTDVAEYTNMIGFTAALYAMVKVDGNSPPVELNTLRLIIPDKRVRRRGRAYLKKNTTENVIRGLAGCLSYEARLCIVANLIEVAMADAIFRTSERELLEFVCDTFSVTRDDYDEIFAILLLKHNTDLIIEDFEA